MEQANNGQLPEAAVKRFGRLGWTGAVAQHDKRCPWPEKVVVEDEEAGDAAQAVEGFYLGRWFGSGGERLIAISPAIILIFVLREDI